MDSNGAAIQFRNAVRLWNDREFSEALRILDELARAYPQNAEVAEFRDRCRSALERARVDGRNRVWPRRRRGAVIIVLACAAVVVGAGLIYRLLAGNAASREIVFPDSISIGTLYIGESGGGTKWIQLGDAQSRFVVPNDAIVKLRLHDSGSAVLPGMRSAKKSKAAVIQEIDATEMAIYGESLSSFLDPAALRAVNFEGSTIDSAGMDFVSRLSFLQRLNLSRTDIGNIAAVWLGNLYRLEELDLRGTYVTDSGTAFLEGLSALKRFLAPERITDESLERVGGIAGLEEIDLSYTAVTDNGMRHIQGLKNLKKLKLRATWVGDQGASILKASPALEELDLSYTRVTDAGLAELQELATLRSVDLEGTRVTNVGVAYLANIAGLKDVNLSACCERPNLTGAALQYLKSMGSLRTLDLSGADLSDDDLAELRQSQLERIILVDTRVSESAVAELRVSLPQCDIKYTPSSTSRLTFAGGNSQGILWVRPIGTSQSWTRFAEARGTVDLPPGLELRLDAEVEPAALAGPLQSVPADLLAYVRFPVAAEAVSDSLQALLRFAGLRELAIAGRALDQESLDLLSKFHGLETLNLEQSTFPESGISSMRELSSLQELDLRGTRLAVADMETLGVLQGLRKLNLSGASLTEGDLASLSGLKFLEELDLTGVEVRPAIVSELRAALPNCNIAVTKQEIVRLTFPSDADVGILWFREHEPVGAIWRRLGPAARNIEAPAGSELRLEVRPDITDFTWLSSPAMNHVQEVCLAGSNVTDDTMILLTELESLEALDAYGTRVTDLGLESIARLTTLRSLRLGGTAITDQGVKLLTALTNLQELDIARTAVTDAGLQSLKAMRNLRRVYIEDTRATQDGVADAGQGLPGCEFFASGSEASARPPQTLSPPNCVIKFEGGHDLGVLWIRDWNDDGGAWILVGPLCCEIVIPPNQALKVLVSLEGLQRAELLTQLPGEFVKELAVEKWADATDSLLAAIGSLTGLESLVLDHAQIEPGALHHVTALRRLKRISLHGAQVDPADFAYLRNAPSLRELDMTGVPMGIDGLTHLGYINTLERLACRRNPELSSCALVYWQQLPALRDLDLSQSPIDARYDHYVDGMASLNLLRAYGSGLSDETKHRLSSLPLEKAEFDRRQLSEAEIVDVRDEVSSLVLRGEAITKERLASLAGVQSVRDVEIESRTDLWRQALTAVASATGELNTDVIVELAAVDSLNGLDPRERTALQEAAFGAWSRTDDGITPQRIAEISGAESFQGIPRDELPNLQRLAAWALAGVKPSIDQTSLAALAGVGRIDELPINERNDLREAVLDAFAESGQGVTPEVLAALDGVSNSEALDPSRRATLEAAALSAMARSETGITAEHLAALSGTDSLVSLSTERQVSLQTLALSAMARSDTAITPSFLAEIAGKDSYTDLGAENRAALQRMALSAMSASATITEDRIFALAGVDSARALSEENLAELRSITLSAMGVSETGIDSALVERFVGDAVIENLSFANSGFGDDGFGKIPNLARVKEFDLSGCKSVTDVGLSHLSSALSLVTLRLRGTGITDSGLRSLSGLGTLQHLDLSDTAVTDVGLTYLANLTRLVSLSLEGAPIEGSGLKNLARLKDLKSLNLAGTRLWDRWLPHLDPLGSLAELRLSRTAVADDGVSSIAKIPTIAGLELDNCPFVTDEGTRHLGSRRNLKTLALHGTQISSRSVPQLKRIRGLEELSVGETAFTREAVVGLHEALPGCRIRIMATTPLDDATRLRMERDLASQKVAANAEDRRLQSFENVPLWELALRLAYLGAILVSAATSLALPFAARFVGLHPLRATANGALTASANLVYAARYFSVATFRFTLASLYSFRWWLLLAIAIVLVLLFTGVLRLGFDEIIQTLPLRGR